MNASTSSLPFSGAGEQFAAPDTLLPESIFFVAASSQQTPEVDPKCCLHFPPSLTGVPFHFTLF